VIRQTKEARPTRALALCRRQANIIFAIDKPLIEQISPPGPVQLRTPKFSNGLLRSLYRAKATFGYANSMVGASPCIRAVPACRDDKLIEPRKVCDAPAS
jgi:hypothetical protein